jgi:hypothetical protein
MSTPTFTKVQLLTWAEDKDDRGSSSPWNNRRDLARYALALVRIINDTPSECAPTCNAEGHADECPSLNVYAWMIHKQRRIDDLEAELDAEKANLNRANDDFEKARAALEAERDDLKEAVAQEKYFRDEDVERLEAGRDAANDRANHYQRQRDELHAENEKLRAAARRLIAHDEASDRREKIENCQELCELRELLGEKDGGK